MKLHGFLMCLMGLMASATLASAQSFLNIVKRAAGKAAQEVVQKAKQEAVQDKRQSAPQEAKQPAVQNTRQAATPQATSRTLPFPENHTALFAPMGYPCDPLWGTKQLSISKPPYENVKQPDWVDALPSVYEYDNASLVKAFKMLDDCMTTRYITAASPASFGYSNIQKELQARCNALDEMVTYCTMVVDEYESLNNDDGIDHGVLMDESTTYLCNALKNNHYKSTMRSSIAPLKEYLSSETVDYFMKYGGFENAHKAKFTVIGGNASSTASAAASGQGGTVISENAAGAHIEVDGITYIVHLNQACAFASKVVEMAVRGKDVVMPDYISYKGKKFPVEEMRSDLFANMDVKSVKLPATLKEIPFRAFFRSSISEIVIPASVKTIKGSAFAECKNLKKVVFESDRLDEIDGCFQGCSALQSITLPRYVGTVSEEMFNRCTNLTSVQLPENLKELPAQTFSACTKLTTINIPAGVTKIGYGVFEGSGVVSLDLSHVMEFDNIGTCMNLKNLKLNAKLKDRFVAEIYEHFSACPQLALKFENGHFVYPAGLVFVDTK